MSRRSALALLTLLAAPRWAAAGVALSASTATATVGERIELRVVASGESGVSGMRFDVPAGDYEVISRRRLPAAASGAIAEIITIAFFQTGDFTVGPFRVELLPRRQGQAEESTGQLAIRVRSLLAEGDQDIQPLKEPLPLAGDPRHLLPYAAAALLAALLLVLALLLRRRRRRRAQRPAAPPLPPEIELERAALALRAKNLWPAGEFRSFFIALSGMLKHFLERAYGFNAGECTSSETVAILKGREGDEAIVCGLEGLLRQSDLVKFARQLPQAGIEAGIWEQIAVLVAEHRKRRQAAEEAARVSPGR